ncbi:hypothetical protein ACWCQZ_47800 [Streptomyces sp. NPDC002285]
MKRRPRLADLYALVERVRGVPFNPNTSMAELIERAGRPGAPDPGVVIEDEGPESEALTNAVEVALRKPAARLRIRSASQLAFAALRPVRVAPRWSLACSHASG